ncbi:hypothetical protein MRX96_047690 [Rhipicephalus microplus]
MSQRTPRPFNWDNGNCPKFVHFENTDSAQENLSAKSYFASHVDTPPSRAPRTLAALSSTTNTTRLKSLKKVDHASQGKKGLGTQPHKSACTASVFRYDGAKSPLMNASASCVYKPNYALLSLK